MNILITGGAGYIGSHVVELLIQKKNDIIILDNLTTGYKRLINKEAIFIILVVEFNIINIDQYFISHFVFIIEMSFIFAFVTGS